MNRRRSAMLGAAFAVALLALPRWLLVEPRDAPGQAGPPHVRDADHVRFVAIGDIGHPGQAQRDVAAAAAAVCAANGCDFGVLLGDNVYPAGLTSAADPRLDELIAPYAAAGIPLYAVLGNHDDTPTDPARAAHEIAVAARSETLHLPARSYGFDAGNTSFRAFDTPRIFWFGERSHRDWLAQDPPKGSWNVAFGHHPYRSEGDHGNAGSYDGLPGFPYVSGRSLRRFFDAALCGRFDLYLAGHDHNRQLLEHCGVALIVSGTGSATRTVVPRGNDPVFTSDRLGFVWIELGEEMRIRFYDASGDLEFETTRARTRRPAPASG